MRFANPLLSCSMSLILAGSVLALGGCGGSSSNTSAIGGMVTGLKAGLTLVMQNNGADTLSFTGASNSNSFTFSFATGLSAGSSYNVTVSTPPTGELCTITGGSGTVDNNADNVSNVAVNCSVNSSVVGTVSGVKTGGAVTLSLNGGSQLLLNNGPFAFGGGQLAAGAPYTVAIVTQPSGQTCTLTGATGFAVANSPQTVTVTCN